jgi:type VI secretion system protein VasG
MSQMNLKSLISKLNDTCRRQLESAASLCLSRTHYHVEIDHWLVKLLEDPQNDFGVILRQFEIDPGVVSARLNKRLEKLKTGNTNPPALSPYLVQLIKDAWNTASLDLGDAQVRSAYVLIALLTGESAAMLSDSLADEFKKINIDALKFQFKDITASSSESGASTGAAAPMGGPAGGITKTPALDQFTVDLTARAKSGKIDPVLGRDPEIRQVIDILTRRRQNNPILTGEAGVGKTSVVEGFALRVVAGDVPPSLQNIAIRSLDLGLLQAGAGVKGEFENRLKSVIDEVQKSAQPIIMFIDEAHTLIGAGGAAGQNDAANLLKPALARGELRTIAATTWAEYKKYFEKDPALTRRFQVVKVEEPSEAVAVDMMRGLATTLEIHHNVRILDAAVVDAVKLSNRYITGRQLPDKCVSLLDTACARVNVSQAATPPAIEDAKRRVVQLQTAIDVLERESVTGGDHREEINQFRTEQRSVEETLKKLDIQWQEEKSIITDCRTLRDKLEADFKAQRPNADEKAKQALLSDNERATLKQQLQEKEDVLTRVQGETPLIHHVVDAQVVAHVVADWTGIPVGRMVADEIQTILNLKQHMEARVVGQSHALELIAKAIHTSRAKLTDPRRPIGVFMLLGPSGVGKTETALTLAANMYGSEQNITVINMSEYKEEHKVSLLMGSPPGYVGYGEGGVLTEAVRRKPYSIVLLDEMEKAHPGIQDVFYQVFDKGMMKDGEGRDIDFKNTIIIMTSNAGTDTIMKLCADPETAPDYQGLLEAVRPDLLKFFKPAFLGRLNIIPYYPLAESILKNIIALQIAGVKKRVETNYKATFTYSDALVNHIVSRCNDPDSGARTIHNILNNSLLPELSEQFLTRMANGLSISKVHVDITPDGHFAYELA